MSDDETVYCFPCNMRFRVKNNRYGGERLRCPDCGRAFWCAGSGGGTYQDQFTRCYVEPPA